MMIFAVGFKEEGALALVDETDYEANDDCDGDNSWRRGCRDRV